MKRIILICAAGMSTSLLVKKMQTAAAEKGVECSIEAFPISFVADAGKDADVILLGPQVRFNLGKVKAQFPDKPVEAIDMVDYGMVNGEKVFATALKLMGE